MVIEFTVTQTSLDLIYMRKIFKGSIAHLTWKFSHDLSDTRIQEFKRVY